MNIESNDNDDDTIIREIFFSDAKDWKFLNWFDGLKYLQDISNRDNIEWQLPTHDDITDYDECAGLPIWQHGDGDYYKKKTLTNHKHWIVPIQENFYDDNDGNS